MDGPVCQDQQRGICVGALLLALVGKLGTLLNQLTKISGARQLDILKGIPVHVHQMLHSKGLNLPRNSTEGETVTYGAHLSSKFSFGPEPKGRYPFVAVVVH